MKAQLLLLASLSGCAVACGGAPFSFPPAGEALMVPDSGEGGAETSVDATPDAADAGPHDAALLDAGPPDAGPPDAAEEPLCSPVSIQPSNVCPLEPSMGIFPQNYGRSSAPPAGGCATINAYLPTPQACRCAETFNCRCLQAQGVIPAADRCKDVGGAPWVY